MENKTITLPLPDRKLSPNARIHWAQRSKLVKSHRKKAHVMALMQLGTDKAFRFKSYRLTFYWPDKRRRDRDNASSCCKSYMDGISDAIGQDDSEWDFDGVRFEVDKTAPRVDIEFEERGEK